jgi:hypothetical protein
MHRRFLVAAAALSIASITVHASETFTLEIRGAGEYGEYGMIPRTDTDPLWPVGWFGSLTIETSSRGDGIYTGADLLSINYRSNYGDTFVFHAGDGETTEDTMMGALTYGMEPAASVTIAGGRIVSVDFHYLAEWPGIGITDGLVASGSNIAMGGQFIYDPHYADAELSGTVSEVPEPAAAALLMAALAAVFTGLTQSARRRTLQRQRPGC